MSGQLTLDFGEDYVLDTRTFADMGFDVRYGKKPRPYEEHILVDADNRVRFAAKKYDDEEAWRLRAFDQHQSLKATGYFENTFEIINYLAHRLLGGQNALG